MRVITGTARGRRLNELKGKETRPTTDRVKEGIFNIIQFDIEGRRVLDLFGGTGQLGIECLSRGAAHATFVDARTDAVKLIRENLAVTALANRATVLTADYATVLSGAVEKYDLVFLDPPYETKLLERSLELISQFDILREHGIIICESPQEKSLPDLSAPYGKYREYRYGKIKVTVYHRD
ncbi:MAG: 16S rRNA (guanine(966)-N(2))-methyltransferase RsmD [Clostridiales bacterium]|nr:16S rRNA (guanine(966)-N(2))-methyltransferase RsmD [bacterium 210917-SL.2.15]MCI5842505.1 16S rRNA (guanine(966)-N(2))-methyltransferase RsmD [Clostridiales bacterium]MDY4035754.1 16S rRNA (guanine(966)-N(2))-methyltransferase RsmD [Candidatus Pseudoscilispira sp.]